MSNFKREKTILPLPWPNSSQLDHSTDPPHCQNPASGIDRRLVVPCPIPSRRKISGFAIVSGMTRQRIGNDSLQWRRQGQGWGTCGPTSISRSMWEWHCEVHPTKCTTNKLDYLDLRKRASGREWMDREEWHRTSFLWSKGRTSSKMSV